MKIVRIKAREILDSRGNPTIETEVYLENGILGIASVPSGASIGAHEALELRDNDPNRFNGKGVLKAVSNVNNFIAPNIVGMDASYQNKIDALLIKLDGTEKKSRIGANAVLSVSQGVMEAAAKSYNMPIYFYLQKKYQLHNKTSLPTPTFNIINGGKPGAGNLEFQEFHVVPSARQSYRESLQCGEEVYQALKKVLIRRNAVHSVGDEGGFAPNLFTNLDAVEILMEAIETTKYKAGRDIFLGIDFASSFFYKKGKYKIKDKPTPLTREQFTEFIISINKDYPLFTLEDPLYEDDWEGWRKLTDILGAKALIVGDDLLCSDKERVQKAISEKACNAILVKPNQVGTISETIEVIKICRDAGWKITVSHRSGETNDDFIADFAVGVGADYTKFGAPARGERIAKYNRLLKIEEELFHHNG